MEMEYNKPTCPILDVDGVVSGGKQFDLNIILPEDNRDLIYGVVKNCFKEPVRDAAVKLVEVVRECGKEERRPIGHTFTDEEGEFVFGPLCPGKKYAIQIWANTTKKIKICAKCFHEGNCLKGEKHEKCDCFIDDEKHDKHEKNDKCKCHEKEEKEDKFDYFMKDKKYDEYEYFMKGEKHEKCDCWKKEEKYDKCEYPEKDKKHDDFDWCKKEEKEDKCKKDEKHDKCECHKKDEKHDEFDWCKKEDKCEKTCKY